MGDVKDKIKQIQSKIIANQHVSITCMVVERNLGNIKKHSENNIIKSLVNIFILKKENEATKDRIIATIH